VDEDVSVSPISELDSFYDPPSTFEEWVAGVEPPQSLRRYLAALEEERASAGEEAWEKVLRQALRTAAVDTGAIEGLYEVERGFTYTIAAEEATWEVVLSDKGPDTQALIESQLSAYELVLDAATGSSPKVTEAWIRRLHEEICRAQDTYDVRTPQGPRKIALPKGEYKRYPNHVLQPDGTEHAYAPVNDTPSEMHRMVEELESAPFARADPILQAAYAHYFLAAVHPFADGNGRVARALASIYTIKAMSVPLVIFADQRERYLLSLRSADAGNRQAFVSFVASKVIDTVGLATERLRASMGPDVEDLVAEMQRLNQGCGGIGHDQLDGVASRILETVMSAINERLAQALKPPLSHSTGWLNGSRGGVPSGYRTTFDPPQRIGQVTIRSAPPASGSQLFEFEIGVGARPDSEYCFVVLFVGRRDTLEVRLEDAFPAMNDTLLRRIEVWIERPIVSALDALQAEARKALGDIGYLPSEEG
jgi:Fic family protein